MASETRPRNYLRPALRRGDRYRAPAGAMKSRTKAFLEVAAAIESNVWDRVAHDLEMVATEQSSQISTPDIVKNPMQVMGLIRRVYAQSHAQLDAMYR